MHSKSSISDYYVPILFVAATIMLFFHTLVGLLLILGLSIYRLRISLKNKKKGVCSLCKAKLTFTNVSAGGQLSDGGLLCRECLQKVSVDVAFSSKKYNLSEIKEDIRQIEREKEQKMHQTVDLVLFKDEQVIYYVLCKYNKHNGYLTLTDKRLLFAYIRPIINGITNEPFYLEFITASVCKPENKPTRILLYMHNTIIAIESKETWKTRKMSELISEEARRRHADKSINFNIDINATKI